MPDVLPAHLRLRMWIEGSAQSRATRFETRPLGGRALDFGRGMLLKILVLDFGYCQRGRDNYKSRTPMKRQATSLDLWRRRP